MQLGYSHRQTEVIIHDKPASESKLHVVISKKTSKYGQRSDVEAVLDACYEVMPLALGNAMEDLGISCHEGTRMLFCCILSTACLSVCLSVCQYLLMA